MRGLRNPTGATRVAAVIGDPVRHSLSPTLHNAAFDASGLDWTYVAFPVAAGQAAAALIGMRALGIDGLAVTMPHKTEVARNCDEASADVQLLDAANTVIRRGNRLRAEVTDGEGCVDALREAGIDPAGLRCLVFGAGGAGRAVTLSFARAGAREIVVVNRDAGRAAQAVRAAGSVGRIGTVDDIADAELIVNATPLGMGTDRTLPFDVEQISRGQIVNDLIYHPLTTGLVDAVAARGATAIGGLGMLVHQAARQFRLWTGEDAPIDAMRAAVREELQRRALIESQQHPH